MHLSIPQWLILRSHDTFALVVPMPSRVRYCGSMYTMGYLPAPAARVTATTQRHDPGRGVGGGGGWMDGSGAWYLVPGAWCLVPGKPGNLMDAR